VLRCKLRSQSRCRQAASASASVTDMGRPDGDEHVETIPVRDTSFTDHYVSLIELYVVFGNAVGKWFGGGAHSDRTSRRTVRLGDHACVAANDLVAVTRPGQSNRKGFLRQIIENNDVAYALHTYAVDPNLCQGHFGTARDAICARLRKKKLKYHARRSIQLRKNPTTTLRRCGEHRLFTRERGVDHKAPLSRCERFYELTRVRIMIQGECGKPIAARNTHETTSFPDRFPRDRSEARSRGYIPFRNCAVQERHPKMSVFFTVGERILYSVRAPRTRSRNPCPARRARVCVPS